MDRRTKSRIDLQLTCRIDGSGLLSEKSGSTTENISRNGLLLKWTRPAPVPLIGSTLLVEVELPSEGLVSPRLIRCESTVVRVINSADGSAHVGLRVHNMRIVEDPFRLWLGDINAATVVQERVH